MERLPHLAWRRIFRSLVLLMVIVASMMIVPDAKAQSGQSNDTGISDELQTYFKKAVLKRVKRLEHYISMIANKEIDETTRKNAINQAVELFESEDKVVQVSSLRDGQLRVRDYPVRTYFDRLFAIQAARVDITFYEVTQLTDVRVGPDNKYYATAFIFQDTKIYYDTEDDIPDYHDKTEKAIDITIKPDTVVVGDKPMVLYPAKLGNINVKETRAE